jgi:hypothetical protein
VGKMHNAWYFLTVGILNKPNGSREIFAILKSKTQLYKNPQILYENMKENNTIWLDI